VDVFRAAVGPDCDTFAVGAHFGDTDFAGLGASSANDWDGFLARVDRAGNARWLLSIASFGDGSWADSVDRVVVGEDGSAWVTAYAGEPVTLAGQSLQGSFVLAIDPAGSIRWAAPLEVYADDLARRADGALVFLQQDGGGLVERVLDGATGDWISTIPLATGNALLLAAVTRPEGRALALCIEGQVNLRGHLLEATDDTPDGNGQTTCDLALVAFDAAGEVTYTRTFVEHGFRPYLTQLDLDAEGRVALSAGFWGSIDAGLGEVSASPIGEGMRIFAATFDPQGQALTSAGFGSGALVMPTGVVRGLGGTWTLSGLLYQGSVDLGGETFSEAEGYLGFDGTFDEAGHSLASHSRRGLQWLTRAEPGLALSLWHSPDGVNPRVETLTREGMPTAALE